MGLYGAKSASSLLGLSIPPILFIVQLEGKQLSDASPKSENLFFLPSLPPSPHFLASVGEESTVPLSSSVLLMQPAN